MKDNEKKRSRKKMLARDSPEKRHRAQTSEGLPLEASPSIEEEDDGNDNDDGMEVPTGFSPEVGPMSASTLVGPYGDAVPSAQGSTAYYLGHMR